MSTRLGPKWPPQMLRTPPHMSSEDEEIYRVWWPKYAPQALATYYDVGLGEGAVDNLPSDAPKNYAGAWIHNTQKRADMLAVMPQELWLIELRHAASSNAIGRLLQYQLLWNLDPALPGPVRLFLVSNHYDPDLKLLAYANKITYEWV